MNPEDKVIAKQRVLNRMRVVAAQMAPEYVARNLDLDIFEDHLSQSLVYRLTSHVLAEDLGTKQYEVYQVFPASWWQHFKRDAWIMRKAWRLWCRWPVKTARYYHTVTGHGYRGYPHAPIALPPDKMGDSVVFETFDWNPS